ncbi:hypothetical protein B0O99DRAFT_689003 [Bisporella sp. PMI_857]|nr:hypothetical protein B0O99DRAFT_689003 [Bisporella sp. PMI_857]
MASDGGVLKFPGTTRYTRGWRLPTLPDLYASENALLRIDTLPEHTLASVWENIVTEYSPFNLTKELDRLLALSGLAERMCFNLKESMQETIEDTQYNAGLWNASNLLLSLLWWARGLLFGKRPRAYLAPSWSWASINSAVSMPTHKGGFELDKHSASGILEVSVQRCGLNPYGEASGGFIRIKCRLKAAISLGKDRTLCCSLDNDSTIVWKTQQALDVMMADETTSRCVGIVRWD